MTLYRPAILIITILATAVAFSGMGYVDAIDEKGTLKVFVNLQNVGDNIGIYEIHVTTFGNVKLEQSKVVHTGTQTCPDDTDSLCYVASEAFSFPSEAIPVGSKILACAIEPSSGMKNCADGQNTPNNGPETIWIDVPDRLNENG